MEKFEFEADKQAARQYFLQHVNQNTVFFHNLREKIDYLLEHGSFLKNLVWKILFQFVKSVPKKVPLKIELYIYKDFFKILCLPL